MNSQPEDYPADNVKRAAAIAKLYMGLANNGGLNSFLTNTWELDASEVLQALHTVGAEEAAMQFAAVLNGLGVPLPAMSQDERWDLLEQHWTDDLNDHDMLSDGSDRSLTKSLEQHVAENQEFYFSIG